MSTTRVASAVVALVVCLGGALHAGPQDPRTGRMNPDEWWKGGMARNYWSPQTLVADRLGKDAIDCGQFVAGTTQQLTDAVACIEGASRDKKASFAMRHFLANPSGVARYDTDRWMAEGFVTRPDGVVRHFDYAGFPIHTFQDGSPPPQPSWSESACLSPRAAPEPGGAFHFACG